MPEYPKLNQVIIDGVWYHPYDAAERDGKVYYADPPVPWATKRVFRAEDGARIVYQFQDEADRFIDRSTMVRQVRSVLHGAGLGRHPDELRSEGEAAMRAHLQMLEDESARISAIVKADLVANPQLTRRG